MSAPALHHLRCALARSLALSLHQDLGLGLFSPWQVLSTWAESLHHRGDPLPAPDFTARACVTAVAEQEKDAGPNPRRLKREAQETLSVPGWPRAGPGLAERCPARE